MNRKGITDVVTIIRCLVDGNSIRATARIVGCRPNTVMDWLVRVGQACMEYQDRELYGLPCKRLQCDEIWSFIYCKHRNVPEEHKGKVGYGDVWTFVAIDAETKLVPCWAIGPRLPRTANEFMADLAARLESETCDIQITTDGYTDYWPAVRAAFGRNVNYGVLQKKYGSAGKEPNSTARKYSPAECTSIEKLRIIGSPDESHISTSYVERQNLTMRMCTRRLTRLTNGFSKKMDNHIHAISLFYMYYNFARPNSALGKGITPAMAAKVSDHRWSLEEIARLAMDKSPTSP